MKKQTLVKFSMVVLLCVIVLIGTTAIGFAQGLVEYALIIACNGNCMYYGDGNMPMSGDFDAVVQTESGGTVTGFAAAKWNDPSNVAHQLDISFSNIDEILWDNDGEVAGLRLNGRAKYLTAGTQTNFPVTVEIWWPGIAPDSSSGDVSVVIEPLQPNGEELIINPLFGGFLDS